MLTLNLDLVLKNGLSLSHKIEGKARLWNHILVYEGSLMKMFLMLIHCQKRGILKIQVKDGNESFCEKQSVWWGSRHSFKG